MRPLLTSIVIEWTIIFCILCCIHSEAFTQQNNFRFDHITDQDGLSLSFTQDVLYDTMGLVWISGWSEIFRYDGQSVKKFNLSSSNLKNGIQGRTEMISDDHGRFWIMDDTRVFLFNPYSFEVDSVIDFSSKLKPKNVRNNSMVLLHDTLWVCSNSIPICNYYHKVFLFSVTEGVVKLDHEFETESGRGMSLESVDDELIIILAERMIILNSEGDFLREMKFDQGFNLWPQTYAHEGDLWIKGNSVIYPGDTLLYRLTGELKELNHIKLNFPVRLNKSRGFFIKDNLMWIHGVNQILFQYDLTKGTWKDFSEEVENFKNFPFVGAEVAQFTVDEFGVIWMGTTQGLIRIIDESFPVSSYLTEEDENCLYDFCSMRGMTEDDEGNIYFSYYDDVHRLNVSSHTLEPLQVRPKFKRPGAYSMDYSNGILFWMDNRIDSQGVVTLMDNKDNGHVTTEIDGYNQLWIFNWGANSFKKYNINLSTENNYEMPIEFVTNGEEFNDLLWDSSRNVMWIATLTSGLRAMDTSGTLLNEYKFDEEVLPTNNINVIHLSDGVLWLGHAFGISRIELSTNEVKTFNLVGENRIPVVGILEDDSGHLWLSTDKGIHLFDKEYKIVYRFPSNNELARKEFNRASFLKASNGRMYFGSLNGVYAFYPKQVLPYLKGKNENTKVVLTEYSKYNSREKEIELRESHLGSMSFIHLTYWDRYFSLKFAYPDYISGIQPLFSYKLEGYDQDWSSASTFNSLRYDNLPPGAYDLRIRENRTGTSSTDLEKRVKIIVSKPWFQRWWFYLICLVIISAMIWGYIQFQIQRRLRMEKMRQKISSDLHDDVGTLLTGLSMQSEILASTADKKTADRLERITRQSRNAMMKMRDIVWAIDSRKDKLEHLVDRVKDFGSETLEVSSLKLEVRSDLNPAEKMAVNVRQNLYLICKEAIANMAKYSNGNLASIEFLRYKRGAKVIIFDNGNQNKSSQSGLGLMNMEKRAKDLGGSMGIDSSFGFRIEIIVPTIK